MEKKNPLEEIREAILESQLLGVENEISQMGVSDELLELCDALDSYCGIKRKTVSEGNKSSNNYMLDPNDSSSGLKLFPNNDPISREMRIKDSYKKTTTLLNQAKQPLFSIRRKLSKDAPFYLDLSSLIVSVGLRDAISPINSYKKQSSGSPFSPQNYDVFSALTGIDLIFSTIVSESINVFNTLEGFDMTKECYEYYAENKKRLWYLFDKINDAMRLSMRNNSSGSSKTKHFKKT